MSHLYLNIYVLLLIHFNKKTNNRSKFVSELGKNENFYTNICEEV